MSSTTWGSCVLCSPPSSIGPEKDALQQEVLSLLWIPLAQGLDAFTHWHLISCIKPCASQSSFMMLRSGPSQRSISVCWCRSTEISFVLSRVSQCTAMHSSSLNLHECRLRDDLAQAPWQRTCLGVATLNQWFSSVSWTWLTRSIISLDNYSLPIRIWCIP